MKKQIFLITTLTLTIFTACKDENKNNVTDDPASNSKKELLTAEPWNLKSAENKAYLNDSLMYDNTEVLSGKIHFMENNIVISRLDGEPDDTSSWSLASNTLLIDSVAMEILEIDAHKLTLEFNEEEVIPDFGTMKIISTTYFTR